MTLAAVPTAVRCARWFVQLMLRQWRLDDLGDLATLLASELVTNAVNATGVTDPDTGPDELGAVNLIRIQVTAAHGAVFISVWDSDPNPPRIQAGDLDGEHGRGLLLVSALSRRWSHYPSPTGGKVVWCEVQPISRCTEAGLPRRIRRPCPPRPAEVMRDRVTLLRVRDGLRNA